MIGCINNPPMADNTTASLPETNLNAKYRGFLLFTMLELAICLFISTD